jgi:UDP-N-acetylglucosamine 2-epimerase (non-hydrolysing)
MIDTLLEHLPRARATGSPQRLGVDPGEYAVVTLHRPSNVDDPCVLNDLLDAFEEIQAWLPIVFPVHPRTRKRFDEFGASSRIASMPRLTLCEPLGYLEFQGLTSQAKLVLTDSGGLQEETTALGIPCLTLRENTERPVTVTEGTNTVVGVDKGRIVHEARKALAGEGKSGRTPALWDGRASERIARVLSNWSRATATPRH